MKNHSAVKFVAIVLCAAFLLGAVGCGLSVLALTELDLYNKTVDQVYHEKVHSAGERMAHDKALFYSGSVLGGCPDAMLQTAYPQASSPRFNPFYYGYELKDAEGNVLESVEIPYGDKSLTYIFPVTGQYMYFVDLLPHKVVDDTESETHETMLAASAVLVNEIPAEGATLSQITISFSDESVGASGDNLGTVFCNQDGLVVMRSQNWDLGPNKVVTAIALHDHTGKLIYEASAENGVGLITSDPNTTEIVFTSYYTDVTIAAEEAVVEATEAIIAAEATAATEVVETSAPAAATEAAATETAPAETAEKETAPAETDEEESDEETETAATETVAEESVPAAASVEEATKATEAEEETKAEEEKEDSDSDDSDAEEETKAAEETAAPTVAETAPPETVPPETQPAQTVPPETVPVETEPEPFMINGRALETYQINRFEYLDPATGEIVTARYVYINMPEMTLELHVAPGVLTTESAYAVLRVIHAVRGYLLPALGICLLLFAACMVYLCCAAGRKPKSEEVRAGALNRIPLDLYGFGVLSSVVCVCLIISENGDYLLKQNTIMGCTVMAGMGYLACLLIVGFLFACAAQFKMANGFWWRGSLCGRFLKLCRWLLRKFWQLCLRLEEWTETTGWPRLLRLLRRIWTRFKTLLSALLNRLYRITDRFLSLLPTTWQWIVMGAVMVVFLFITLAGRYDFGIILSVAFAIALTLYGANCFGRLMDATRKMNKGNLESQVDDKMMVGSFREFAAELNDLASVAAVAAQKQLKSERMKTELITNVTHDIKTPLTSIINYVDLLQKPHSEEEGREYLDVLDRQSQQLKKLVEDLIDMSKASTGNMVVELSTVDAVESVNQALGEFSDKLERANLTPVFRHTEDSAAIMADGKLVWRVMNNLLSNAVKYAMPGTRLYIDLMKLDNRVLISFKNISRDELNVDAEELMERFVRGDIARNTEGSGLGLNIAKSLMELQHGQLQLLVDGDLFKVTLIFPGM